MITVDTNILVYAHREDFPLHQKAKARLKSLAEGEIPWSLPILCVGEFLRVVTHPKLFIKPSSPDEAWAAVQSLLMSPILRILFPSDSYLNFLQKVCAEGKATGNHIFDAQIVALMCENGVDTILSEDRDFGRFKSIRQITL